MIDKTAIRALANQASYSDGKNLYQKGAVLGFSVDDTTEIHFIEATVLGEEQEEYEIFLQYDTTMKWMEDSHCECEEYGTYSGLCKHCIAVLFAYEADQKEKQIQYQMEKKQEANLAYLESLRGDDWNGIETKKDEEQTTPQLKQLLTHQKLKVTLPVLREDIYGKVKLEPYFYFKGWEMMLEFKIGMDYMYILKDVFKFAQRMEQKEDYAYGQKLHFIHSMEMFTESSKKIVEFVCNWAKDNKGNYISLKAVSLGYRDLEQFIDAVGYEPFCGEVDGFKETMWQVTASDIKHHLNIERSSRGIEVSVDQRKCILCIDKYFYFDQGHIYKADKKELEPIQEFLLCIENIPDKRVFIEEKDIPAFCKELLPILKKFYKITNKDFDENEYISAPAFFEIYLDCPKKDVVTCKALAVYGEDSYNIFDVETNLERRDLLKEHELSNKIWEFCNVFDEKEQLMLISNDDDKMYQFLMYGIPEMQQAAEVYISDAIKKIHLTSAPKPTVGISLSGDFLELQMAAEDMSREQLLEILSKYNRKKKFFRLKNGDFVNMDGEGMNALLELKDGLNLTQKELKADILKLPKYRALYLDSELKAWQDVSVQKDKSFKTLIRNMKTVDDNDFEIPEEMKSILREYQKRGYLWIKTLKSNGLGGILADDMGLGKTLQVIAFLESERQEKIKERRTLIVVPTSLVFNWTTEIQKFAPKLKTKMIIGNAEQRKEMIRSIKENDIVITSYDLLRRDIEYYDEIDFANQIIDEAQFIKNHNTKASKSVKKITAAFKLALTGTPIENRLSELWSIFDYLMSGFLYSYKKFRDEFEQPIIQDNSEEDLKRLRKMIQPFILRRLKKDVLKDLPDKLEKNYFAQMETEQRQLYDAHVKQMQLMLDRQTDEEFKTSRIQILSELTKLRQICCHPELLFDNYKGDSVKMDLCMELIQNGINGGHKILLFSQFTSMLSLLEERMKKEGISFYTLTGAVKKEKRAEMVDAFNHDDTAVFCISLKAGGTGLNLTSADIVIHYDPWWNLAVQNQATDRAHRIGQENIVMVYKLIVEGTIEDNILKLQEKKRELSENLLGGESMGRGSFTREELRELLQ
ncbi:MAG: SNF2 helicase associated domain-containing protein [Anaerostipes sp.]|nr:SNF2 helicase associated domain-containing protein [Anaerostipes sp.]